MSEGLTADEVLRQYANGERDFTNMNLRGTNFAKAVKRAKREGQVVDLSNTDFSGAQIQGANFAGVKLCGANFTGAQAGLQKRGVIVHFLLALLISAVIIFIGIAVAVFFSVATFSISYTLTSAPTVDTTISIVLSLLQVAVFLILAKQGYTIAAAQSLLVAVALTTTSTVALAAISAGANEDEVLLTLMGAVAGAGVAALTAASAAAGALALLLIFTLTFALEEGFTLALEGQLIGLFVGMLLFILLSIYVSYRALAGDSRFIIIRTFALMFKSWGGTCFYQADLTEATFAKAVLKSTNFDQANLTRTCFRGAEKLTCARFGGSILQNWDVLHLLLNGRVQGKDFIGANLRGAYLAGADLTEANFTRANLSEATLENAQLVKANLKETAAIGTNFTRAHLTGACLEAWNINSTTILKDIDCQFVFLLEQPNEFGDRERRPYDLGKVFGEGEFEQLFNEVLDEVQILIKNGIQPDAFRTAMQRLMEEHNITSEDLTAYQRKGNDVQVSFKVLPGSDKGAVERTWNEGYQAGFAAAIERIKLEQLQVDDFKEVTLETTRNLGKIIFNVTATSTSAATANSTNPNITIENSSFVNTGSMDGNTVNLGTISGNVTNAINQLPDQPQSDQPSLKDLLTELQAAIEAEPQLSDDDKAEALEQVKTLAEAGQKPQDSRLQKAAKTAMKILRGTTAGISETTQLAEAAAKLLPAITAILTFL